MPPKKTYKRKGVLKKKKGNHVGPNWLFKFLDDISMGKENILGPHNESQYSKFMITRFLSVKESYLPICNILNIYQQYWDNYQFHKFCIEVIPKKKVYWSYGTIKGSLIIGKHSEEVKIIADYFKISNQQAFDYYKMCGKELVTDINALYGKID